MDSLERLGAVDVRAAVKAYRDALRSHQESLNRLNVYPVPDGDTGTNMALTLESVVTALDGTEDMAGTCKAISHGSLMGARGNSGVILCQVLRGLCDAWKDEASVDAALVAEGLRSASEAAYGAVMKPVEGTILTVAAAAARGGCDAQAAGEGLAGVLDAARLAAAEALEATPDLLPVLKEAGVVDAGGAGFVLLLDALLHVTTGRSLPEPAFDARPAPAAGVGSAGRPSAPEPGGPGPRFEVMYLLEGPDESVGVLKAAWAALGDSIVVVGGDGTWSCHIHTDEVGPSIEAALDAGGRPRRIQVTDLHAQVEEERGVREAGCGDHGASHLAAGPAPVSAVVAVAAGEGLAVILRSLGAHRVVTGGQSMNPSVADLLAAVDQAPADQVLVLPNNKNIVPVAEQVAGLTAKTVAVVPTRTVPEGMAALLEYDAAAGAVANAEVMSASAASVVSGEVTRAVRASSWGAGAIAEGAWLGLAGSEIEVVSDNVVEAATGLLEKMVTGDHELVTVIEGEGATSDGTRLIRQWVEHHRPEMGVEVLQGGQPLYPYLLCVE